MRADDGDGNSDAAKEKNCRANAKATVASINPPKPFRPSGDAGAHAAPASICRQASDGGLRVKRRALR